MSLVVWLTPWKPATMAMCPASRVLLMRPGVTSMIRAAPWASSVMTPAWLPVKERASAPSWAMAMATRAMEIRSPDVRSMSSSRAGGAGVTCSARSSRSSVVSPMAETTTQTALPARWVSTMRRATRLIDSASATDDPVLLDDDAHIRLPVDAVAGLAEVYDRASGVPVTIRHGETSR